MASRLASVSHLLQKPNVGSADYSTCVVSREHDLLVVYTKTTIHLHFGE